MSVYDARTMTFSVRPPHSHCRCLSLEDAGGIAGCKWDYTGTGTQYDLLAGPIFVLVFTIAGVPLGIAADLYNRKVA